MRSLIISLSLLLSYPAFASEVSDTPPPMPAEASEDLPKADIRVVQKGDVTMTEYRINGHLYQIRVQPAAGPEYYLVDPNGRGNFVRQSGPTENIAVPRWVLFRW